MTWAWETHTYPITILWKSGKLLGFTVYKRNTSGWVVTTMQRNSKHLVPLPVSYCWMRYSLIWYTWYSVERCLLLNNLVHAYFDKLFYFIFLAACLKWERISLVCHHSVWFSLAVNDSMCMRVGMPVYLCSIRQTYIRKNISLICEICEIWGNFWAWNIFRIINRLATKHAWVITQEFRVKRKIRFF